MALRLASDSEDLAVAHEINVTPFIDVMLVLLIIFMVAAPLATVDTRVDLPISNARPAPRPEQLVYLSIQANGSMTLNDEEVSAQALGAAVAEATGKDREQRVFLRADKTITYDTIMSAMNALRAAGYLRVALVGAEAGQAQ
ncbi:TonB system transport protein ExbD [Novosphingobium marinum]|uniref:Biopolymer transport protein ExbD n=1 Tax=Novosphingobium marinum TaxID=1514948 RepID=A0A7Y9Y1L4_9SPHN|nr:TonB system transport protein ExbD [Novosphingobium marinum]NYH97063.1 biopolymer transport protein ExbD [Novosphingobium marinum]GGC43277.1 TonB system transport protein ExbD [Novosphingobium marinum]